MAWMVVRVRGGLHVRGDIVETMRFLHLTRPNHATVVPETPEFRGMLTKVQGYVTWGEVDPETLVLIMGQRGTAAGGGRLTEESGIADLATKTLSEGMVGVEGLKPLFRLKPPKGGWRSTKKPFRLGGALGYRGGSINHLARRMV